MPNHVLQIYALGEDELISEQNDYKTTENRYKRLLLVVKRSRVAVGLDASSC